METLICFIVAGSMVCEVKPLDRERGDYEPIEIVQERRAGTWPPQHGGDLVLRCHDPNPCQMKYAAPPTMVAESPLWRYCLNNDCNTKPKFNYSGGVSLNPFGR